MTKVPKGMVASPFMDKTKWLDENNLAFVWLNLFPVSKGHVLIIPKRIVLTPFDLTDSEVLACFKLLRKQEGIINKKYVPDGYNIGWNVNVSAGQSVAHAHLHLIPRYEGDHPEPRGGICKGLLPQTPDYYSENK